MSEMIRDISEITYSREIYDAKPRPYAVLFIYLLLAMIGVALVGMTIGKIEIITKANGYVRPNQKISSVVNGITGEVESISFENGQQVSEGDTLYVINHEGLDINQGLLQSQIDKLTKEISQLEKYKDAIQQNQNMFDPISEEVYYERFEKFSLDYRINENEYVFSDENTQLQLEGINTQIADINAELVLMHQFEASIDQNDNKVKAKDELASYYSDKFEKYKLDYATISQQYTDKGIEIQSGQSADVISKNLEQTETEYEGYTLLLKSIQVSESVFKSASIYADMYQQYLNKIKSLQNQYTDLKSIYELSASLTGTAVTASAVEQSRLDMNNAFDALENYKMDYLAQVSNHISDLEVHLLELANGSKVELSKENILLNNEDSKERALNKFKADTMVALEELRKIKEQNLVTLNQSKSELALNASRNLKLGSEDMQYAALLNYKTTEVLNVIQTIESDQEKLIQLESELAQINKNIEQSIVKAKINGRVNVTKEIAEGDNLFSGTQILTIIPDHDSTYKVEILMNNKDIAKVKLGESIKYHFQALPYKDYGNLTGHITQISSDARIDETTGQSFYYVEATLDESLATDYKGNISEVMPGMYCEAQVITDEKSILRFLLEKIDLLD